MTEILICRSDELANDAVRIVEIGDLELGLIRHGDRCYGYRNLCPHQGGPACEGLRMFQIEDVIAPDGTFVRQRFNEDDPHIVCPWHGYEFHLSNGEHVCDPRFRLQRFEVSEREGHIYVRL